MKKNKKLKPEEKLKPEDKMPVALKKREEVLLPSTTKATNNKK